MKRVRFLSIRSREPVQVISLSTWECLHQARSLMMTCMYSFYQSKLDVTFVLNKCGVPWYVLAAGGRQLGVEIGMGRSTDRLSGDFTIGLSLVGVDESAKANRGGSSVTDF